MGERNILDVRSKTESLTLKRVDVFSVKIWKIFLMCQVPFC